VVCGEEVAGELVIFGGDASPVLDAAEEVFDLVPAAIDGLRAIGLLGCVAAAGNGWDGAIIGDLLARSGAAIGLVSDDEQWRPGVSGVRRQHLRDRLGSLRKGGFVAHRNPEGG
jgi:hypothetical protein